MKIRKVEITDVVSSTASTYIELVDAKTDTRLPPMYIYDKDDLMDLLQMADDQELIYMDEIDIPDNLDEAIDETIRPLIGCTLRMPVQMDRMQ